MEIIDRIGQLKWYLSDHPNVVDEYTLDEKDEFQIELEKLEKIKII